MNGRVWSKSVIAAVAAASISITSGCRRNSGSMPARTTASAAHQAAPADSTTADSAAGEVSADSSSAPIQGQWLTDANALSLLATLNAAQIAAASVELQGWRSDTARAFATSIANTHAQLQRSADSLAAQIKLAPIAPALGARVDSTMQAQTDSLRPLRGGALDRAFLAEQYQAEGLMANYVNQLTGVVEHPALQALLASMASTVGAEAGQAHALQQAFVSTDSLSEVAAADSAAKRAHRHKQ